LERWEFTIVPLEGVMNAWKYVWKPKFGGNLGGDFLFKRRGFYSTQGPLRDLQRMVYKFSPI